MIGKLLGRYAIESKLGEGGMGVVFKARDTQLERAVAIKVLPPGKVADPDRKRRFVQEAKAASALNHPHIITIYDVGSDGDTDFIVMEYLAGTTLDHLVPAQGLPLKRALAIAVAIADALAKAHEAGIVHRDLKPSNVMITDAGGVKVLDFGVAKLIEPAEASGETRTVAAATEEGTTIGTPGYMSPEQAEGRRLDGRSDIFSFGAVLYEMVTGRKAFSGEIPAFGPGEDSQRRAGAAESSHGKRFARPGENDPALPAQGSRAPLSDDGGSESGARGSRHRIEWHGAEPGSGSRAQVPARVGTGRRPVDRRGGRGVFRGPVVANAGDKRALARRSVDVVVGRRAFSVVLTRWRPCRLQLDRRQTGQP
jgi:serine/threonine protein kinase